MPNVLHVIEYLDRGGAARSTIATARYSARQGSFHHTILALERAEPEALALARTAGIEVVVAPEASQRTALLAGADIIVVAYWNAPRVNAFLRGPLPPARLAIWYHIAGDTAPQLITPALAAMPDLNIACCPYTFDDLPLFAGILNREMPPRTAMVYGSADFERLEGVRPQPHDGFNVGYIGTIDFVKMHPDYVRMSAGIDIPGVRFVVCGNGMLDEIRRQAANLGAAGRFDVRGYVSDIAPVISTVGVYGYPLCEDTYAAAEVNLQEVMYAGVPPVVFPYGGVKRLVRHNDTGLIVHSAEDYKRAIEYLYHNPHERRRLGDNAAEYARRHFGAENAARTLNTLFDRLMQAPKRLHAWNRRPDEVAAGAEIVPPALPAARLFVDSVGEHDEPFRASLAGTPVEAAIEAEATIAGASGLMARTGFMRYRACDETDPHLRLWTGLYMERQGMLPNAITEYAGAIEHGLTDWRVQWYLARALYDAGKVHEARRIYDNLRRQTPDFDAITGDRRTAEAATPPMTLTTAPPPPATKPSVTVTGDRRTTDTAPAPVTLATAPPPPATKPHEYRVSAIVSTYNAEAFIDDCLHDLVNQTLFQKDELEIIVIDACSEQNERAIVERYQRYYDHIRYERAPERETLYASWNRAIKMARGQYLTSANTDDRHRRDALEVLANYLDAHPEFALIYAGQIDTSVPNETFETTTSKKILDWPPYSYAELERHCIIGSQPMWRRNLHDRYGYFREEFVSAGDYEFWLRIGKHENFYRYPETLGLYYRNLAGIEHGSDASHRETLRIWQEYGMFERGIPLILGGRLVTEAQIAQINPPAAAPAPAFDALITRFETALYERNYERAQAIAETAIEHYAHLPYPFVLQAIALRQQEAYEEAIAALQRSIEIDETPEALVELIQLSRVTENNEEADQIEAHLRRRYPEWGTRLDALAGTPPEPDTPALEQPAREDDLGFSRLDFEALKRQFEQLLRVRDVQQAESLALAATKRFADNPEAWVLRATSFRLKGQLNDAQEAIQRSLLIRESPEALLELMQVYQAQGKEADAKAIAASLEAAYPYFAGRLGEVLG